MEIALSTEAWEKGMVMTQEQADEEGVPVEDFGPQLFAAGPTLSLDANVSEIAMHLGVTNFGYTLTRSIRDNTLSLVIITK